MPSHTPLEQFLETLTMARQERQRRPAPGDVEAFPGLTSTLDSISAIVGSEIRRGRPLPEDSDAAGLTRPGLPDQMRLRPDFAEDSGVMAHEGGHLLDFRAVPAAESARADIPEEDLPNDASVLENLLDPVLDTGDRGEAFAKEVERAFLNVDRDTDDEVQQALRELLRSRLARGERRARERTRFTRDATAVRR